MTDFEFEDGLKKTGMDKKTIDDFLYAFQKMKNNHPSLTLDEWFEDAKRIHEKNKNEMEKTVSTGGGVFHDYARQILPVKKRFDKPPQKPIH